MGQKVYYQASIENHKITRNGLLKLAVLLLVGMIAFGNLYVEENDFLILSVTVVLAAGLVIDLYWWIKINTTIAHLQDELLNYFRGC